MKNITDNDTKLEILMKEIEQLLYDAVTRHQSDMDAEKQWMLLNCSNTLLSKTAKELSMITLHILDAIGRFQPVNSITITKKTDIPKGTVSKNIRKLLSAELIVKVPLPDNKKEAVFYLTSSGKELYELHRSLHQKFDGEFYEFLKRYTTQELQFLVRFLKDFQGLTWTGAPSVK